MSAALRRLVFPLVAAACVERPQATTDEPPPSSTTEPTTIQGTTAEPTTAEPSTSTGSTTDLGTGSSGPDTSTGEPGPPGACGRTCEDPWIHAGDLQLWSGSEPVDYTCMTQVAGSLHITASADPAVVATLRDLQRVELQLTIEGEQAFADPSVFSCLREVGGLYIQDIPSITDIAPLSGLREVVGVTLVNTGLTTLPTFPVDFTGVNYLTLKHNAALTDLSPAGGYGAWNGDLLLEIEDSPALADLSGVAGLMAAADFTFVRLVDLPVLAALTGLEPLEVGGLHLEGLPLIADLSPLSQMQDGPIQLADMPGLTSLAGLSGLTTSSYLVLGDCLDPAVPGLVGVQDLTGLDSLTQLDGLVISNCPALSSLAGAPLLSTLTSSLALIDTPALMDAAVDAFLAQLAAPPADVCHGDWDTCGCH